MRRVDRALDPVEPVAQGSVVHLGRRCDVGAEEAQVEAAKAAQRAEALALPPHRVHGSRPVDLDSEPPRLELPHVRADAKGHGHGCKRVRLLLEDPLGLLRRLAADVDARDPHAVGDPARAAGEGKAEHDRGESGDSAENGGPLPDDAALCARAGAASRPPSIQKRSSPGGQDAPV